jgi:uncharacterized membrane protein YfcA
MILSISYAALVLAAVMTFGAAAIRGLTGFGMAIILVPLLGLIIAPADAVVVGIIVQLLIAPVGIGKIIAEAERKSALTIAAWAVAATPLGLWLLGQTSPDLARMLIAMIAIGAFALVLLPPSRGRKPGGLATGLTGIASGILTGFAAMPGPPVVPFYMRQKLPPVTTRASMMLVFFATSIAGTLSAFVLGVATTRLFWLSLLLFPAVLAGNWIGGMAFGKVPEALWRSSVAAILGMAGVAAVVRLIG